MPARRRMVVPELPQSMGPAASRRSAPCIMIRPGRSSLMRTPNCRRHKSVVRGSAEEGKLVMTDGPWARAAKRAARCATDLSAGSRTEPSRREVHATLRSIIGGVLLGRPARPVRRAGHGLQRRKCRQHCPRRRTVRLAGAEFATISRCGRIPSAPEGRFRADGRAPLCNIRRRISPGAGWMVPSPRIGGAEIPSSRSSARTRLRRAWGAAATWNPS